MSIYIEEDFGEAQIHTLEPQDCVRIANAIHEERCPAKYWQKQCERCAGDNLEISRQRSVLETRVIKLELALKDVRSELSSANPDRDWMIDHICAALEKK